MKPLLVALMACNSDATDTLAASVSDAAELFAIILYPILYAMRGVALANIDRMNLRVRMHRVSCIEHCPLSGPTR